MQKQKTKQYIRLVLIGGLACILGACKKQETVQRQAPIAEQSSIQDDVHKPPKGAAAQEPDSQPDDQNSLQRVSVVDGRQQEKAMEEPEEDFKEKRYAGTDVYLRAEASKESKDLALLSKGSVVYQSSQENGWSHVKDQTGKEGYVCSRYLTNQKPVKTKTEKKAKNNAVQKTKITKITNGKLVVIDPGHQQHANSAMEPLGPGSSEMKAKETGGTSGVVTGMAEYQLNLDVSQKLRDELLRRGYEVIMVRETNDVDMGNIDRAEIANHADADVFIRIHANGSQNNEAAGMMSICQTPSNPYNGQLYPQSRRLAEDILDCAAAATGAKKEYVWETDSMCGINWSQVPVTIFEMGYMSNPQEDVRLSQSDYQDQIASGIADGIDRFYSKKK